MIPISPAHRRWFSLFLVGIAVVVYLNSLHGDFHFDDKLHLLENPQVRGLHNFEFILNNPFRALLWLTFQLNHEISGYETFSWHVVNMAMHALNVLLVFFLGRRILGADRQFAAWAAALLFAVHPLQTESVSYIISRSELMVANFYLGSLLFWVRFRQDSAKRLVNWDWAGACTCFLLGLWTKESMITLPVMIGLWEVYFQGRKQSLAQFVRRGLTDRRWWLPLVPLLVLFAGWFGYRWWILQGTIGNPGFAKIKDAATYHWSEARVLVRYLWMHLLPIGQNLDPDLPTSKTWAEPWVMASLVFHGLAIGVALWFRRRRPEVGFSILWFYLAIAPSSSLVPLEDIMAEHRVYLASIGVFWVLMLGLEYLVGGIAAKKRETIVWAVVGSFALIFSVMTIQRNRLYRHGILIWGDAVEKSPNKPRPHYNLGNSYFNIGKFDLAIAHYTKAVTLDPQYLAPYFNRGNTYNRLGRYEEALRDFQRVVALRRDFFSGWFNMGVVYDAMGDYEHAVAAFQKVLLLKPNYFDAYNSIGAMYFKQGQFEMAKSYFQRSLRMAPQTLEVRLNLAVCHLNLREFAAALPLFEQAVREDPQNPKVLLSLAYTRSKLSMDPGLTRKLLDQALLIKPQLKSQTQFQEVERQLGQVTSRTK